MLKLPYALDLRHPRAKRKIERHKGLVNYDRARILMFDDSLVHWSTAEVTALCQNLHANVGAGYGCDPLELDPDVEDH